MSEVDSTDARVGRLVRQAVLDAYPPRLPEAEPTCGCGHELGAHHGPDGEGRCGETGCGCDAFHQAAA